MADTKKSGTYQDAKTDSLQGNKPKTGSSGGLGGVGTLYDSKGNIISNSNLQRDNAASRSTKIDLTDPKYRIGDYVFVNNKATVVPNSLTDYYQRYLTVYGAQAKKDMSFRDWMHAAGTGLAAFVGAGDDPLTLTLNQAAKATPMPVRVMNAIAQAGRAAQDAEQKYIDEWLNQSVTYDYAFDIKEREDGSRYIVIDYDKMKDAGYGSGSAVRDARNIDNSSVSLDGNGGLNVNISAAFANSDNYKEIVKSLKEAFPDGISEEEANEVVDEETGTTRLQTIENYIKGEESRFYYNASSTAEFKRLAPNASDEAIDKALETQLIGSYSKSNLEKASKEGVKVTIYDENNQKVEVDPSEYLNHISQMDDHARNDYMVKLGDRISSNDVSDDEKVILKAQANALYSASNNKDSGYGGMYKKDFWDSIADTRDFLGVRVGSWFGNKELTTFEDDEILSGLLDLGSTAARMYAAGKMTKGFENMTRSVTTKLGTTMGGKFGNAMASFGQAMAAAEKSGKSVSSPFVGFVESLSKGDALGKSVGELGRNTAMQMLWAGGGDFAYDTLKAGAHGIVGEDYDFWDEFKTDLVIDLMLIDGPSTVVNGMSRPYKYEYRRAGDRKSELAGNGNKKLEADYKEAQKAEAADAAEMEKYDEFYTGEGYDYGEGHYYGLVEVTAKQLAQRRADQFNNMTNNKMAMKIGETFFDKNFAIHKLAWQYLARTGDNLGFRELIRQTGPLKQLTQDAINKMYMDDGFNKVYQELQAKIREVIPSMKNLSDVDARYMNASENVRRFSIENKGNKEAIEKLHKTYDADINGVSKERAAQLDELMTAMRKVYSKSIEYYHRQGLLTDEEFGNLTKGKVYGGGMYFPVWTDKSGLDFTSEIKQGRKAAKEVRDKGDFITTDKFLNPLDTFIKYQYALAQNIAINERALAIRKAAETAGIDLRVISDDGGGMAEFEDLKTYSDSFNKRYQELKKEVDEEVPTFEEWQRSNVEMAGRSGAMRDAKKLGELQTKLSDLQTKLRELRKSARKEKTPELEEEIAKVKLEIEQNKNDQMLMVDSIVHNMTALLKRAQKSNKYLTMKLDVDTFVKTKVQESLREAVKAGNSVGAIQNIINEAVNEASPYVTRESVLKMKASEEAVKYRKTLNKVLKKKYAGNKGMLGKIDRIADRIMDRVTSGIEKDFDAPVTEKSTVSQILGNYSSPDEIRYFTNGQMHTMKLKGVGSEMLVDEFYNGEKIKPPKNVVGKLMRGAGKISGALATGKRTFTTAMDVARVLPNLLRDWTRGIVTSGGNILMSPNVLESYGIDIEALGEEGVKRVQAGMKNAASNAVEGTTLTESLAASKAAKGTDVVRAAFMSQANNPFTKFAVDLKTRGTWEVIKSSATFLQDSAETYTRRRVAETAYNKQIAQSISEGKSVDAAIQDALGAATFYGREATTNFGRRGTLIAKMARQVPYLSQKFGSLVSLGNTYLDNPLGVARAMKATVSTYSALIAIALSNEESRKKYFLLSEYERSNNVIIPLDNDTILTIPLDDNIAAFLTPYRRMIESLNGVDPEAFYLWGRDFLEALSPFDISGFSEGDSFNVKRGFEKLGAQNVPTWALPILENMFGRDWYYGSDIAVTDKQASEYYDNPNPTPGELTKSTKNSVLLEGIANATGIPQWKLQTYYNTYLGNVGQYVLYTINKASGAPEKYQGGKDWVNSIFKPFTGADSDAASSALWDGIELLKEDRKKLRKEIAEISKKLTTATGDDKVKLENQRQEKISAYGLRVSDFVNKYLNAYEITGGLSQAEKNRIWHLYDVWSDESADGLEVSMPDSLEEYYEGKASSAIKDKTTNLAAESGLDKYAGTSLGDYYSSYGAQAFKNSLYGRGNTIMAKIAKVVEDTSDYANSIQKARSDLKKRIDPIYQSGNPDYDAIDEAFLEYDKKVLEKVYPILEQYGVEDALEESSVMKYLKEWIRVPYEYRKTAKGRYVPKLKEGAQTEEAFKRPFIKYLFGASEE